jgi:hypothetical protein
MNSERLQPSLRKITAVVRSLLLEARFDNRSRLQGQPGIRNGVHGSERETAAVLTVESSQVRPVRKREIRG